MVSYVPHRWVMHVVGWVLHRTHHLYGQEPYGVLCPIIPPAPRELPAAFRVAAG